MISLADGRPRLILDGTWRYTAEGDQHGADLGWERADFDASGWREMQLPTNWYRTEVGDFFGAVWFRREFRVPGELRGSRLFLRFSAVDYIADVWLNGSYLGRHEGMFNPFEFDVTDRVALDGINVVAVRDDAPRDGTEYVQVDFTEAPLSTAFRTHQALAISQIKGHMIDAMHRPGATTSMRSDGNTGGIWDSVELIARPDVYVDLVTVTTRIVVATDRTTRRDGPDGTALVSLDVAVCNATGEALETEIALTITSDGRHEHRREIVLPPGRSIHKVVTTVPDPRLWWTWDRGEPHLYTASVSVAGDTVQQRFGIKELVHDEVTGQWSLNGERLFLRGMRYISSQWMSEPRT
jgi:beta-mannosidase